MSRSTYTLSLKVDEINAASERAFTELAFLFGRKLTQVISEPRMWDGWSGPRDLIDTGQLRSSQQLVFTRSLECVYSWPVEHAAYVALGYETADGRKVEGRNWLEVAQQEFDVQGTFEQIYRQKLNGI